MRYIVLLLVLLIGAGFVFINWPAVNAPVEPELPGVPSTQISSELDAQITL